MRAGTDLRQFSEFIQIHPALNNVQAISKEILRDYLQKILAVQKPKTARRKAATLRAFLNFLEYEDHIQSNPFRKLKIQIKEGRLLPRTIPHREVTKLLAHVHKKKGFAAPHSKNRKQLIRDIAVIEMLFASGLRVSEVSGLQKGNVDLHRGTIQALGKGNRERTIPVCCDAVLHLLQNYAAEFGIFENDKPWFFVNRNGKRLSEQSIRFMIRRRVQEASIDRHITPHMFRHTVATQLLRNGMDIRNIQHLLGHSSILTTQIYTHIDNQTHRRDLRRHHPRGRLQFPSDEG